MNKKITKIWMMLCATIGLLLTSFSANAQVTITVQNDAGWGALYIHAWVPGGSVITTWENCPAMTNMGSGQFSYTFNDKNFVQFLVKDATGNTDNKSNEPIATTSASCFILSASKVLTTCSSAGSIVIKAQKPADWDDVMYAYMWTIGEGSFYPMEAVSGNPGWFEYTFEDVVAPINVIFVNGGDWTGGESKQTLDIPVWSSTCYTISEGEGKRTATLTNCPGDEPVVTDITVKAQKPADWDDVMYAYMWTIGEGSFYPMTAVSGNAGWFEYTFEDVIAPINVIFVNGGDWTGGESKQTSDIPVWTSTCYTISAGEGKRTATQTNCPGDEPGVTDITVKAQKPADWDDVMSAYMWTIGEGSFYPMTAVAGNAGWFEYTFEDVIAPINVIFVNGGDWTGGESKQTLDIPVWTSTCYTISEGEGKRTATQTNCPNVSINEFYEKAVIYTQDDQIVVLSKGVVQITDISSRLFDSGNSQGEFISKPMQKGIYMVSVDGKVYKIAVK